MTRRSSDRRIADMPAAKKRLPVGALVSLGIVIAVVAGASVLLWMRNEQPGPALERWASATRDGDCQASYDGLSSSARSAPLVGDEANWCRLIGSPEFIGVVTAGEAQVKGNTACVRATITPSRGPDEERIFVMVKEQGSWKVDVGGDPGSTGIAGCRA